jgi:putative pyruvate formate lyase activating enzyme
MREQMYEDCTLCPRECHINRLLGEKGFCRENAKVFAARAGLHMWEEPCLSGKKGSGAVFFSGCSLGCIFCQNREISRGKSGKEVSTGRLAEIFLILQEKGAANINLVTGEHYVPSIMDALDLAKKQGLCIPVVYNSSGYEKTETLKLLKDYVDVYLPDFKYWDGELAFRYSGIHDYRERAKEAIREMVSQRGKPEFTRDGYLKSGVIVRHLILPGHTKDSKKVLEFLYQEFGKHIYISIMNQYTPMAAFPEAPELERKVTKREYQKVLEYALSIGIEQGFFQEGETAKESFIPPFDLTGI